MEKQDEVKPLLNSAEVLRAYNDFVIQYFKINSKKKVLRIAFFLTIYNALLGLKHYLENPEEKEINYDNPVVELLVPVEIDWGNLAPYITINFSEIKAEELTNFFIKSRNIFLFKILSKNIAWLKQGNKYIPLLDQETIKKLEKLPKKKRKSVLERYLDGDILGSYQVFNVFDPRLDRKLKIKTRIPFTLNFQGTIADDDDTTREFCGAIYVSFGPLIIDKDQKLAYYTILVGIHCEGYELAKWKDEDRKKFWDTVFEEINKFIPKEKIPKRRALTPLSDATTFAVPSHSLMFTLLAMFSGKPERIPRKLLEKPDTERTPEEQKEAEEYLDSIISTATKTIYDENNKAIIEDKKTAIISDNPKVKALANIDASLFRDDPFFEEESLAIYIKKAYKAEGLRHLLGLLIGLEENFRRGFFIFNINEHLERLGYQREPSGSFNKDLRMLATGIVRIFTSLFVTAIDKKNDREVIRVKKLFTVEGAEIERKLNKEIIDETIELRATDFWYKNAFEPRDGSSPQFTKLLKKIARENHRNHPLTIYLAPLFAMFWRIKPEKKLSVQSLMDWCNLDYTDDHKLRKIRDLEGELNYMKEREYLGDWTINGEHFLPSETDDPLKCVITLTSPEWFKGEMKAINENREGYLLERKTSEPLLTKHEFERLFESTGLSMRQFANYLGVSVQMISLIKQGKRNISPKIDAKIKAVFGYLLPV